MAKLMEKKKFLLPSILLGSFLLAALAIIYLFHIDEKDHENYSNLIERKKSFSSSSNLEKQETKQLRENVKKDIWLTHEDSTRHHIQIKSALSSLSLKQKKSKYLLIENLSDIECWIQDKVTKDQYQHLRYFTAEEGTYRYPSHRFIANEIHMDFLTQKGTDLPEVFVKEHSFLEGTAKKVVFQLGKKTPLFHAYHFSAQLDTKKGGLE